MNGSFVPPEETSTSDHGNLSEATVHGDIVVGISTFCNFLPQVGNFVPDPIKLLFRVGITAIDENHFIADRKSTRLNSSHVRISYAVFCLKKKTHPPFAS